MVTTSDHAIAERVRSLRNHGEDDRRLHVEVGYCSRLHGLQAALLSAKLPRLERWNRLRRDAAAAYTAALSGGPIVPPAVAEDAHHVYHLYVVRVPERERFRSLLAERGVQSAVHYAVPLHLEPAFAHLGYHPGDFPAAERAAREIVSLPMFPHLQAEEVRRVAEAVEEASYG